MLEVSGSSEKLGLSRSSEVQDFPYVSHVHIALAVYFTEKVETLRSVMDTHRESTMETCVLLIII